MITHHSKVKFNDFENVFHIKKHLKIALAAIAITQLLIKMYMN